MRLTEYKKSRNSIYIGTCLIMILFVAYGWQLTVPVISDETITMGNDISLLGKDWTLMVNVLGGYYYRYFQALMAFPLFKVFEDSAIIYRMTMCLQGIIYASIVPVIYIICRRHLNIQSEGVSTMISIAVCLNPSLVINTFYFRGDYLLAVLPWYTLWMFLEILDTVESDNVLRRVICSILIGIFCVLAYMSHTRGIVLVIAVVFTSVISRIILKKKNINWIALIGFALLLLIIDHITTKFLRDTLYLTSGVTTNSFDSVQIDFYFNIFSFDMIKSIIMLSICWTQTLASTTLGLLIPGVSAMIYTLYRRILNSSVVLKEKEFLVALYGLLVFCGFFAVGALYFKGTYLLLATGVETRRSDRLLYDRYAICGIGFVIFCALYVIAYRREICKRISNFIYTIFGVGLLIFSIWKFYPIAVNYKGYIYNTVVLATFQKLDKASEILFGIKYSKQALLLIGFVAIINMTIFLVLSRKKKFSTLVVLSYIIIIELALTQYDYMKVRKASNDYIETVTKDQVNYLDNIDSEITTEYPLVLKGGLPGVKIQFYQGQLLNYRFFGTNDLDTYNFENYFILTTPNGINKWRELRSEDDCYQFKNLDYSNENLDVLYVTGKDLIKKLESKGYILEKKK